MEHRSHSQSLHNTKKKKNLWHKNVRLLADVFKSSSFARQKADRQCRSSRRALFSGIEPSIPCRRRTVTVLPKFKAPSIGRFASHRKSKVGVASALLSEAAM